MDVDWSKTNQGRKYYNAQAAEDFAAAGKRLPWEAAARRAALSATAPVSDVKASANGADNASNAEHSDDMPTVPIPARKAATTFDTPSKR